MNGACQAGTVREGHDREDVFRISLDDAGLERIPVQILRCVNVEELRLANNRLTARSLKGDIRFMRGRQL